MPPYNNHIMRYFIIMYAPTARPNVFASASAAGLFTRSPSALHANGWVLWKVAVFAFGLHTC